MRRCGKRRLWTRKKNPDTIAVKMDWACRFLSLEYGEKMTIKFFGKRGIAWLGARVMWCDPVTKKILHYFLLIR